MQIVLGVILVLSAAAVATAGPLDVPGAVKAMNCTACHGPAGQSPSSTIPILAGMNAPYFKKAIEDYASGRRPSPEMEPYAKQVRELGMDDIAAYFTAQKQQPTKIKVDAAAVERGRAASMPCTLCHGPRGEGDATKGVPDLRGQPPGYLRNQMILFKQDRRSPGDEKLKALKALMRGIPEESFADLAAYFSSQGR
ncbi:MAG TPA: c-type cytochrome [Methylomirabilota bacterium]|nr:c-type cytochrome [Methylomirabilota bacterium]